MAGETFEKMPISVAVIKTWSTERQLQATEREFCSQQLYNDNQWMLKVTEDKKTFQHTSFEVELVKNHMNHAKENEPWLLIDFSDRIYPVVVSKTKSVYIQDWQQFES